MSQAPKAPPPHFASRTEGLEPFLAMEVMERAFALEREGVEVDHLEIGEPDLPAPRCAVEACERALSEGQTHYSDSRGLIELREAIARDASDRFGASVDPGSILVTSGTSPAMLLVFSLLLDPGDEVIIPTPHYPCYPNFVRYCGGVPVFVETHPQDAWAIDVDAVRARVTNKTRAIMISAPANPTGAIQSRETVDALAALGVPILSDEIYDGLVYDGAQVASAHCVQENAFVLDGFSKRYAMTGFRLGWVVAPDWAARRLQIMQQNLFISASRFVQHAGIAALEHGAADVARMREVYAGRRERLAAGLQSLGFGLHGLPKGAFYLFVDARRFGANSLELANTLLERAHVGVCPGIDFGKAGEGMLRFCYAVSEASIDRALERLGAVLPELEARNSA